MLKKGVSTNLGQMTLVDGETGILHLMCNLNIMLLDYELMVVRRHWWQNLWSYQIRINKSCEWSTRQH